MCFFFNQRFQLVWKQNMYHMFEPHILSCLSFSFAMSFVSARWKCGVGESTDDILNCCLLQPISTLNLFLVFLPLAMMRHVVVNRVFSNDFNGYKRDPGFIINNLIRLSLKRKLAATLAKTIIHPFSWEWLVNIPTKQWWWLGLGDGGICVFLPHQIAPAPRQAQEDASPLGWEEHYGTSWIPWRIRLVLVY